MPCDVFILHIAGGDILHDYSGVPQIVTAVTQEDGSKLKAIVGYNATLRVGMVPKCNEKDTQTLALLGGQNKTLKDRRGVVAVLSEGLAKPKLTDQVGVVSSGGLYPV